MNWKRFLRTASVALLIAGVWIAYGIDFSWREKTTHADTFAVQNVRLSSSQANGAQVAQITPSANGSVRIYSVGAACGTITGGSAGITIGTLNTSTNGIDTFLWSTGVSDVGTNLVTWYWPTPLQGPPGRTLSINLGTFLNPCNGGSTSNVLLEYQYSVN